MTQFSFESIRRHNRNGHRRRERREWVTSRGASLESVGFQDDTGTDFTPTDLAIVGLVFLKSVYSVFNYEGTHGKPAVGFAAPA